jgi:tetratricopeptide (TPR) repeat protein
MAGMLRATRSSVSPRPAGDLGVRLRQLRLAAGLTQGQLAGERFSKEYVSQIERGKTRPTEATVAWLATRLGVDPGFLRSGLSAVERDRLDATLARGDALVVAGRAGEAVEAFEGVRAQIAAAGSPELRLRALVGEARARAETGDLRGAIEILLRAREVSEDERFSDLERAEVLFGLGVCRYKLSSISTALGLLNEALALAERPELPSDQLKSRILHWRSRCYRRQRDYEAAREDVERALELAQSVRDPRLAAHLYFQASLVADREGHYVLARSYAERAKSQYEEVADLMNVGRLLNNLGGLHHRLGNPAQAIAHLKQAFATALELGNDADAAQAISSLSRVNLDLGDVGAAEDQARRALRLLDGRDDYLDEIGSAQVVLGRALLEQDRLDEADAILREADRSFELLSSAGHRASAWIVRGDVELRRGDDRTAARLYRQAAEALQDVRF